MTDYRCSKCGRIAFKGELIVATVEVKCHHCNAMNRWTVGDPARAVLDKNYAPTVA